MCLASPAFPSGEVYDTVYQIHRLAAAGRATAVQGVPPYYCETIQQVVTQSLWSGTAAWPRNIQFVLGTFNEHHFI